MFRDWCEGEGVCAPGIYLILFIYPDTEQFFEKGIFQKLNPLISEYNAIYFFLFFSFHLNKKSNQMKKFPWLTFNDTISVFHCLFLFNVNMLFIINMLYDNIYIKDLLVLTHMF